MSPQRLFQPGSCVAALHLWVNKLLTILPLLYPGIFDWSATIENGSCTQIRMGGAVQHFGPGRHKGLATGVSEHGQLLAFVDLSLA